MRILFLHLSDAHIKSSTDLREINVEAIVKSLTQVGDFDECILVFSGDVANSGEKNAYINAGKMIGRLVKSISSRYLDGKFIKTIIVPGNHDNFVKNKDRTNFDLEEYYKNKQVDLRFSEDIDELSNFYEFASRNRCDVSIN